jgi:hypothetical protein
MKRISAEQMFGRYKYQVGAGTFGMARFYVNGFRQSFS